jgi:hypothetical protein
LSLSVWTRGALWLKSPAPGLGELRGQKRSVEAGKKACKGVGLVQTISSRSRAPRGNEGERRRRGRRATTIHYCTRVFLTTQDFASAFAADCAHRGEDRLIRRARSVDHEKGTA